MSMLVRIATSAAAIGAATVLSVAAGGAPAQAAAQAGTYAGCEAGYVCIYPDASFNHAPILKFYTYGAHNLSNVHGVKRIFNNQTDGARAQTCRGYHGADCNLPVVAYTYWDENFTPINSVRLIE
jgi:hypothetical protein